MASASREPGSVTVRRLRDFVGEEVRVRGWLYNRRSSGKIAFLLVRDGTGVVQAVASAADLPEEVWDEINSLGQESSLIVRGVVRADSRSPGGHELQLTDLQVMQRAEDYPLALKEHGVEFLLDKRHLWLRTPRQTAVLRVRDRLMRELEGFLREDGFVRVDTPILTPNACEGTTTLFETDYFGEAAYLTQSGQLYSEATCAALGKVYCFSPAFRAEKSKTRRHLIEFWMLEPEMAYYTYEDNLRLQEQMVEHVVRQILRHNADDLETLGRKTQVLQRVETPFPRISYDDALELLREADLPLEWGDDFGAPHETEIARHFDRPVFVERFPVQTKAFYMEPDPERPEVALAADLLAPEGYGEIIGGSQRIDDEDLLLRRVREHNLPEEDFEWYLDLRRYGSVPHSGFGLGIERMLAWIAGLEHIREAVPFPRLLNRLRP
ncbi:MAG: asparagine--tRNA ligase [Bacillota bacterium]